MIGLLFSAAALAGPGAPEPAASPEIRWQAWSDSAFARAKAEKRLVILDLVAVWCHWCHVMEETTYRDPEVVRQLRGHFVALRVDQDSRPDLSNRYEDYGWPATVIFDADGRELVKFAGYIPPSRMRTLLEGVVADPTPGPSVAARGAADALPARRSRRSCARSSRALLVQRYDKELGGWGFSKKYLDWDSVEYCLSRAREGDADAERMAFETLTASRKLIDPVWGGLYQYSDSGDWDHPHFEKLLQFQAEGIRLYAAAYAQRRIPRISRPRGTSIRYVRAFLKSPEGAFYVSQDADLVAGEHSAEYFALERRGAPAEGDPARRHAPLRARERLDGPGPRRALRGDRRGGDARTRRWRRPLDRLAARAPGRRFPPRRGRRRGAVPGRLGGGGRAFLALWAATGDRVWLARSRDAAGYVAKTFAVAGTPGLISAVPQGRFAPPKPQRDENVAVARWANLLFRYTGEEPDRRLADRAMEFLVVPEVARRFSTASVLLADAERSSEPPHLTVVGRRDDAGSRVLLAGGGLGPRSLQAGGAAGSAGRRAAQPGRGVSGARIPRGVRLRQRPVLPAGLHPGGAAQENDAGFAHPAVNTIESDPRLEEDSMRTRLASVGCRGRGRLRGGGPRTTRRPSPPLASRWRCFPGSGSHRHPIATAVPEAQKFFDQGMILLFGFNHDEAFRSFEKAADARPEVADAALGHGARGGRQLQRPGSPVDDRLKKARAEVDKALALSQTAPENERAYVEALSRRYVADPAAADKAQLARDYNAAMSALSQKYPDDLDAATPVRRKRNEPAPLEALPSGRDAGGGDRGDRRRARVGVEARAQSSGRQPLLHPRRRGLAPPRARAALGRASGDAGALGRTPRAHARAHLHAHGQLPRRREVQRGRGRRGSPVHPRDRRERACIR